MNESRLQRSYNYPLYTRDPETLSDNGFLKIHNASLGGTLWTCVIKKDNQSYYFDSSGGHADSFF